VKQLAIPASNSFDFCGFLADPPTVQDWNIQGLPGDAFSTANGVMVTRGKRWPLLIDPQVGLVCVWSRLLSSVGLTS
jgi:dynein heavy chain